MSGMYVIRNSLIYWKISKLGKCIVKVSKIPDANEYESGVEDQWGSSCGYDVSERAWGLMIQYSNLRYMFCSRRFRKSLFELMSPVHYFILFVLPVGGPILVATLALSYTILVTTLALHLDAQFFGCNYTMQLLALNYWSSDRVGLLDLYQHPGNVTQVLNLQ